MLLILLQLMSTIMSILIKICLLFSVTIIIGDIIMVLIGDIIMTIIALT